MENKGATHMEIFKNAYQKAITASDLHKAIAGLTMQEVINLRMALEKIDQYTGLDFRQKYLADTLQQVIDLERAKRANIAPSENGNTESKVIPLHTDKAKTEKAEKTEIRRFVVGQKYSARSICDHECIFEYEVIKRTDKSIWIIDLKDRTPKPVRRLVEIYNGAEIVFPSGKYSMAHSIKA